VFRHYSITDGLTTFKILITDFSNANDVVVIISYGKRHSKQDSKRFVQHKNMKLLLITQKSIGFI